MEGGPLKERDKEQSDYEGPRNVARGPGGCLDLEPLLAEFAEGGLDGAARRRVEAHLKDCAACGEMLADVSLSLALCRAAGEVAPPPRIVARILDQTTGKLSWKQRLRLWVRPVVEPRLALGMVMAVLSFSIVLNAFDVNFGAVSMADLSPARVYRQLERRARLAAAGAVKYYSDLRIVYEIQTQLQTLRESALPQAEEPRAPQAQPQRTQPRPQPQAPAQNKWSRQPVYVAGMIF